MRQKINKWFDKNGHKREDANFYNRGWGKHRIEGMTYKGYATGRHANGGKKHTQDMRIAKKMKNQFKYDLVEEGE